MLSKREAAESIPRSCGICPFFEDCGDPSGFRNSNGGLECSKIRSKWLKKNKINNEWKELEIGNLPPDILVGDYEFQFKSYGANKEYAPIAIDEAIGGILNGFEYLYRKKEIPETTEDAIHRIAKEAEKDMLSNKGMSVTDAIVKGIESFIDWMDAKE